MIQTEVMNYQKFHNISVTKANALLAKHLSNHEGERFCLNCFYNFPTVEILKKHEVILQIMITSMLISKKSKQSIKKSP